MEAMYEYKETNMEINIYNFVRKNIIVQIGNL